MYDVSAREAAELFGAHLSGVGLPLACVVSGAALPGRARTALASSLRALGYDDAVCFVTLSAQPESPGALEEQLDPQALFLLIEALDPLVVVSADAAATDALSAAYRCPAAYDATVRLLGRSVVTFSSFDSQLDSDSKKQRAWALLKKLPRLD